MSYSPNSIPSSLMDEIKDALKNVMYGSVEIYVQDKKVTQITVRNIKKTSMTMDEVTQLSKSSAYQSNRSHDNKIRVLTIKKQ